MSAQEYTSRFPAAMAAVDAANAGDPHTIEIDGAARPKEQTHAEMMCEWVRRLDPDADEVQMLAARAHHLRRWSLPRHEYPEGRRGYLRWRTELKRRHAEEVAAILGEHGYSPEEIERVQRIVRKEGLGSDPAVQTHEDALCLVFLQTQLDETAAKLTDDKALDVLRKTAAKMSPHALDEAARLDLSPFGQTLLRRALGGSP